MQKNTVRQKMTDLEVVQRVLDFWDPLGATFYSGGNLSQIDEYDSYSFPILELLRNGTSQGVLLDFLNRTEIDKGSLNRDENAARNRFFSWALLQTWSNQKSDTSNIRIKEVSTASTGDRRVVPRLEILQQVLQDQDKLEHSKLWLYGADTLHKYDEAGVVLDEAIGNAKLEDVCFALEVANLSESEKVAFCLENPKLKGAALDAKFHDHLVERSKRHKGWADYLLLAFSRRTKDITRRIKPRA